MSNLYATVRYDYVGSFLRPAELKKAAPIMKQEPLPPISSKLWRISALPNWWRSRKRPDTMLITERRVPPRYWHLDFMWGFDGVGHKKTNTGLPFHERRGDDR